MNDTNVISCEQCEKLIRVPMRRGSINVKCPYCQTKFLWSPDFIITKKKCPNCGYRRQEKDNEYGMVPLTDCPKCGAIYEKVEKYVKEKERQEKEREEQEEREQRAKREQEKRELAEQQERYRKDLEERKAAEIAEQFKPKAKLGFFKTIAVKTAVKKSLLDITDRMNRYPDLSTKEKVEMFVRVAGMTNELPFCEHWEGTFSLLVVGQTRGQLTTLSNFNDYMPIILELTSDWINRVLGGKSENLYAEIIKLGSES